MVHSASQIFLSDRKNENLQDLLNSNEDNLLQKYEKIITTKAQNEIKQEQNETIKDMKFKLKFHSDKNEFYVKQHQEILNILNITSTNEPLNDILSAIKELKKYEENEIANISNADLKSISYH